MNHRTERKRSVTPGAFDGHVGEALISKPFRDNRCREFRGIAIAAQMTEDDPGEVGAGDLGDKFGRLFIGKMTVPIADALFGRPGAFGVILQENFVVVCFGEESVHSLEPVDDHTGDVSYIAEHSEAAFSAPEEKSHRIYSIVGDRKRLDLHSVDPESSARIELLPDDRGADALADKRASVGRCIDGDLAFPAEDFEPAGVIAVLVGENHSGDAVGIHTQHVETGAKLTRREPGIDENAGVTETDQSTVARAAAPENRQVKHTVQLR